MKSIKSKLELMFTGSIKKKLKNLYGLPMKG